MAPLILMAFISTEMTNFIHLKNLKELFLRSDERINLFIPQRVAKCNARLFYCEAKIN